MKDFQTDKLNLLKVSSKPPMTRSFNQSLRALNDNKNERRDDKKESTDWVEMA
jgi:hypothetical protein